MQLKNIANLESIRLIAVASQVFGYESTLETLRQEAQCRRTTAETREEIDYLISVQSSEIANNAMVINIVDNLIDKLEGDKFECPRGFMTLEGMSSNYTEPAKRYLSALMVITLQVAAGSFIVYSPFRDLPAIELTIQALALVVLVGLASVIAAWGSSLALPKNEKTVFAFVGYMYAFVYGLVLYKCDLQTFYFSPDLYGFHWVIVWATIAPTLMPILGLAIPDSMIPQTRGQEAKHFEEYEGAKFDLLHNPQPGSYQERINQGIVHIQEDIRIHPND
jgi:hypothetical protein